MSNNWRDSILNEFVPDVSKLTLVADPDCLLTEEKLAFELRQRGFDLIEFNDSIEFRYAYESKYRSHWDKGENTDLAVILRLQNSELDSLPYDLLQKGRKLSFNLGKLFPNLSYSVIEKLDRSLLDALYEAQYKSSPDRMGDNATKDFILRYIFGIAAELITNDVELLRALLRLHYGKIQMPIMLSARLAQVLRGNKTFLNWALDEIVPDDKAFFQFLQERWPIFLKKYNKKCKSSDNVAQYNLLYNGTIYLPFDHQDIKLYIDNLFVERKLIPVQVEDLEFTFDSWIQNGILIDSNKDKEIRITNLFEIIMKELPTAESRYTDWTAFALKWADLTAMVLCSSNASHLSKFRDLGRGINETFALWLQRNYSSLINLPPGNPAMLHHIPRRLARDVENYNCAGVALIVVDGLSLDQWVTVRQLLHEQNNNLIIRDSAVFAWIPTLTSVSRQAIFAGKPPLYFQTFINSTNNEEKLWKQFWEGYGLSRLDIAYKRGLGDDDTAAVMDEVIHPGKTKAVGLVIDKVDKIMHGMQLGTAGMHNQIRQWCSRGFLNSLINYLLDYGYEVWMTSDHGNIECLGKGRPSEGVIAETRGERVRVYPTIELRSQVAKAFSFAREWEPVGLPSDYFPLVAENRAAFINPGDSIVGHGGIAIEEVIVPLVKFERKKH